MNSFRRTTTKNKNFVWKYLEHFFSWKSFIPVRLWPEIFRLTSVTFLILSDLLTAKFQTSLVLLKPECELNNVDTF